MLFLHLCCSFLRDEPWQNVPPHKHAGEQFAAYATNYLEPLFSIPLADQGKNQVIDILEDRIAGRKGTPMFGLISGVFCRIEPLVDG